MKSFFDAETGDWFKPYMAHELGHYYFGTYKRCNAELGDMLSEGFAEFLSLKVAQNLIADTIYAGKLKEKMKSLAGFRPIPFSKIKTPNDYQDRELYVYYYAPIIFSAIEKEIGQERMWKWIQLILNTPADFTNYAFVTETLKTAINEPELFKQVETTYLLSEDSMEHALNRLQQ